MNAGTVTATVNPKKRINTTILIALYAALALFSLGMGFFDIATGRRVFGILFLIAALIFIILLLIKGNSVFGTNLKYKDGKVILKSWANTFLPYNTDGGFFSDLKPSRTKVTAVSADEITTILIGTKEFVKRNMTESGRRFVKALYPYEHSSKKTKRNMITGLDIFYLETKDGNCAFMCVQDYSVKNVVGIINEICLVNPDASIKVNNREYKRYVNKLNAED